MNWSIEIYDRLRRKTDFGLRTTSETLREIAYMEQVLCLEAPARVLDLCCGAARHSIALAAIGHTVTGIDASVEYLEDARATARARNVAVELIYGDIRRTPFGLNYDAAICMFHSFGFFSDEENNQVLRDVYVALKPGGRFLIELLNRDWVLSNFQKISERTVGDIRIIEHRAFDLLTSRSNFITEYHEGGEIVKKSGSWRLYSAHELKSMMDIIGFKLVYAHGEIDKTDLKQESPLMRLVFEKITAL